MSAVATPAVNRDWLGGWTLPFVVGGAVLVGIGCALGFLAGLGALAAVAAGIVILRHPTAAVIATAGVVPAIAGLRRGLPVPGLKLSELIVVGVALLVLASRPTTPRLRALDALTALYVAATVGFGILDLSLRGEGLTTERLGVMVGPLQYLLLLRVCVVGLDTERARGRALGAALLGSIPVSLAAFAQLAVPSLAFPLTTFLSGAADSTEGPDAGVLRVTGLFPHWHPLGGYELVVLLLGVAVLVSRTPGVLPRPVLVVVLVLAGQALVATLSFAPILCALVGMVGLVWWITRRTVAILSVLVVIAVAGLLFAGALQGRLTEQFGGPATTDSSLVPNTVAYRYEVWTTQYIPALSGHVWTGWGPCCNETADLPPEIDWPYTESLYILLGLRGGLPLLVIYAALMVALARTARAATRGHPGPTRAAGATLFVLVGLLVLMHVVMPYFVDTGLPHLLWLLAGVTSAGIVSRGVERPSPTAVV